MSTEDPADRRMFRLPPEEFDAFADKLNEPTRVSPKLARLVARPLPWRDEDRAKLKQLQAKLRSPRAPVDRGEQGF